jgi:hypothetical protein
MNKITEEMITCQHCQHWFTDPDQVIMPGRGICLKANYAQGEGFAFPRDEDSKAHAVTTVVSAFGYEMAINQLETTADFGCNQIVKKDPQEG